MDQAPDLADIDTGSPRKLQRRQLTHGIRPDSQFR